MDEERDPWPEDCAPHYLSPHAVRPTVWNYAPPCDPRPRIVNFSQPPPYHHMPQVAKVLSVIISLIPFIFEHRVKALLPLILQYRMGPKKAASMGICKRPCKFLINKANFLNSRNIKNKPCNNYGAPTDPGFDFQSVVSMEILQADSPYVGSRNDEVVI